MWAQCQVAGSVNLAKSFSPRAFGKYSASSLTAIIYDASWFLASRLCQRQSPGAWKSRIDSKGSEGRPCRGGLFRLKVASLIDSRAGVESWNRYSAIGRDEFNASLFKTAALQFCLYRSTAHTPVDIFCDPARGGCFTFCNPVPPQDGHFSSAGLG
jgi:hypothetical protein